MPNKLVITGFTGPGREVTTLTIEDLRTITINFQASVIETVSNSGAYKSFQLSGLTTGTIAISGGVWTITLS